MSALDKLYLNMQTRTIKAAEGVKRFWKEERGVSNVVATIILVLIVVLIIAVFWEKLNEWLNSMMTEIFEGTKKIDDARPSIGGGEGGGGN